MNVQRLDKGHNSQQDGSSLEGERSSTALVPLKTTLESRASDSVIEVYITAVPIKKASSTLNIIRNVVPKDGGHDLQHLRRFAKHRDVPQHVRGPTLQGGTSDHIFLILAVTSVISQDMLIESLSPTLEVVSLYSIQVPRLAPTSQEQASQWTSRYWPTVYKKNNPFGPHPSIVSRAEDEIRGDAEIWMGLAARAASNSKASGFGEEVGVAIIERKNGTARPVAVAGDARWLNWPRDERGNATAHATLRGIAMVADALRRDSSEYGDAESPATDDDLEIFESKPNSRTEEENQQVPANGDGYLCHELEIYCTHEPCVMCSMAIVHSRFGRVVFKHRMPSTGGLCADGELRHGLFWRKELNWTLLAWQLQSPASSNSYLICAQQPTEEIPESVVSNPARILNA